MKNLTLLTNIPDPADPKPRDMVRILSECDQDFTDGGTENKNDDLISTATILRRTLADIDSLPDAFERSCFDAGDGCTLQWAVGRVEVKPALRRHGLCDLEFDIVVARVEPVGSQPKLEKALAFFHEKLLGHCRHFSFKTIQDEWVAPLVKELESGRWVYELIPADAQCRWIEAEETAEGPAVFAVEPNAVQAFPGESKEWAAAAAPRSLPGAPNFKFTLLNEPCVFAEATENQDATARLWIWTDDENAVRRVLTVKAGGEADQVLLAAVGEENAVELDLSVRFDELDEKPPVCELSPRRTIVMRDAFAQKDAEEDSLAGVPESLAAASDSELPAGRADAQIPIPSDSDVRVELRSYGGVAWLFSLSYEGGDLRLAGGTLHYAVGAEKGSFVLRADGGDRARGAVRLAQPFAEAERAEISIEFVPGAD